MRWKLQDMRAAERLEILIQILRKKDGTSAEVRLISSVESRGGWNATCPSFHPEVDQHYD